jgi:hypothetical protein
LSGEDKNGSERIVTGYMCLIDWQHELGEASGGTLVYASLEDLKRNHAMWESCGVAEVEVRLKAEVVPQNLRRESLTA